MPEDQKTDLIDIENADGMTKQVKMVVNFAVIGLLGWVAITVQESTKEIAVLQTMVVNLQNQVSETKSSMSNRYTSYDAEKDFRARDSQINHNTNEIEMLNKRLETLDMLVGQRHK